MALGALALTAACSSLAPGNVDGSVEMVVVTYDPIAAKYVLQSETVSTLKKLRTLEGDAATLEIGTRFNVDLVAIANANPSTTAAFHELIVASAGKAPDFDYFFSEGVVQPADATALALATTYFNFESAQLLFARHGVALPAVRVAYDASLAGRLATQASPITDSLLTQPYLRAFSVPQSSSTKDLPPEMQIGVVGHQYAHAVFQSQVFAGEGLPWLEAKMATPQGKQFTAVDNLVRSIDEGLADYFGATLAEDAAFVRTAPGTPDADRRLDPPQPRCVPVDLSTKLAANRQTYNPHVLGSVFAALFWDLAVSRDDLQKELNSALIKWEKDLGAALPAGTTNLTLVQTLELLARKIPESLKPKACGLIFDRFRVTKIDVPSCNTNVRAPEQKCAF
jgi:hypothetical protein